MRIEVRPACFDVGENLSPCPPTRPRVTKSGSHTPSQHAYIATGGLYVAVPVLLSRLLYVQNGDD